MFSNFFRLDLLNETCVAIANLQWGINKNSDSDWISDFYGYQKCMFVVCWVLNWKDWSSPLWSLIECGVVDNIWRRISILLSNCLYDVCSLILTEPQSNQYIGGLIKRSNRITPTYLQELAERPGGIGLHAGTESAYRGGDFKRERAEDHGAQNGPLVLPSESHVQAHNAAH